MKAVLMMTYGALKSIDEISPFYTHIFQGRVPQPDILRDATARFRSIGVADPLASVTARQAKALERRLKQNSGEEIKVYQAMKHTPPFIDETVQQMIADGVTRLYTFPMSPLFSRTGTVAYQRSVNKALVAAGSPMNVIPITHWHLYPQLVEAISHRLQVALQWLSSSNRTKATVLFTAHSQPGLADANTEFIQSFAELAAAVAKHTDCNRWELAYRSGGSAPQKWLKPDVLNSIEEVARDGGKAIVICELLSLTENVEAIFDCRFHCQQKAEELGLEFVATEFLNDSADFIDTLSDLIQERMNQAIH